jgi:hypothetical protein
MRRAFGSMACTFATHTASATDETGPDTSLIIGALASNARVTST